MRRPLTWSIAAGAAACLILLLRCKNRAKAHKFNPSKLQNHDSFSSDLVLHLSRKRRKHQPQGSPLQRPQLRMFQVDVENFDNEVESYEIEAYTMAEAAEIAQSRFGADAYNMNIYSVSEF